MKKIITLCLSLCMTAALAAPAYALEYSIDAPNDYDFGKDTSIEVIHTADGGAMRNEDVSKNATLIPPAFGSESMNALHTGEYLTPNLAPRTLPTAGAVISGSGDVVTPGSTVSSGNGYQPSVLFTEVASDLYYKNGSLGKIEIPALGLSVRIYQGTDSKTLAKGVGHFEIDIRQTRTQKQAGRIGQKIKVYTGLKPLDNLPDGNKQIGRAHV